MGLIYRDLVRVRTQEALYGMGRQEEVYYGTIAQYTNRYLWKLEDCLPEKDTEVWGMFQGRPAEYLAAIRIRDDAIDVGGELRRNFLIWKREKTKGGHR